MSTYSAFGSQEIAMKSRKNVTARRPSRRPPLSLTQRIERLERHYFAEKPAAAPVTSQRFTKLGADGKPTTGDHVAVFDSKTGLTWLAGNVGGDKSMPWREAVTAAAAVNALGKTDWRAPTIEELLSIVDYTRCDPAVDTEYFKGPFGWTWSATEAKSPAGFAWGVLLGYGYSYRGYQCYDGLVRAVRSGQQLGILDCAFAAWLAEGK
jgi:hypothetical protein